VPSNTGMVIDQTAVVSAYGEVVGEHQYFSSDSIGVRCTFRLGQNVVCPNRIGTSPSQAEGHSLAAVLALIDGKTPNGSQFLAMPRRDRQAFHRAATAVTARTP
jgi:hypothetical protein